MLTEASDGSPEHPWHIEGWLALGFVLLVAAATYSVVLPALSDAADDPGAAGAASGEPGTPGADPGTATP